MVIVVDALTAGLLVFFGVSALTMVAEEHAFIRRFVIAPITQLTHAIETSAAMLKSAQAGGLDVRPGHPDMITAVDNLSQFMRTYRSEFMTANNPSKYAERFRSDLHARNQDSLIAAEEVGVAAVEQALDRLRAEASQVGGSPERIKAELQSLRVALRGLLRTNGSFVEVSHTVLEDRTRTARFRLVLVGVIGVILSTLLGLRVRRAVIPRMNRIVTAVRDFQRGGRHQRVNDMGNDEITVLANAVDAGLEAIERRDREREHFLSVAAHELKTPLTSILGFTQAALEHPENEPVRRRALEVIRRHARRLGRLVEDLFLAAGAQTGQLQFPPRPRRSGRGGPPRGRRCGAADARPYARGHHAREGAAAGRPPAARARAVEPALLLRRGRGRPPGRVTADHPHGGALAGGGHGARGGVHG